MDTDHTDKIMLAVAVIVGLAAVSAAEMPNLKVIFAAVVVAFSLSLISNISPRIANSIAILILFGVSVRYLVQSDLLKKLGIMGNTGIRDYKGLPKKETIPNPRTPDNFGPADPGRIDPQNSGGFQQQRGPGAGTEPTQRTGGIQV